MSIFRAIFSFFYEIFFGCHHERQTRPFTLESHTYKVCLDCGSHIYYSSESMRPLNGREIRRMRAVDAVEVKVTTTDAPVLVPSDGRKSSAA